MDHRPTLLRLALGGGLAACLAGCAFPLPQAAPPKAPAPQASQPKSAPPQAPQPPPAPTAVAPTAAPASRSADAPPHFATPDAAMRYLVAAYNSGDEAAVRHVTSPSSREPFEAERQWVKSFAFRSCAANGAPNWDYTCVLDIAGRMPGVPDPATDPATGSMDPASLQAMNEVTVLVAPAATPGWYLEANEGCGGG